MKKTIPVLPVSQLNDPALERLIDIYYFLKDGNAVRDATKRELSDFGDMRRLLEGTFPRQFKTGRRWQDISGYTPEKLSRTFNNVYDFYADKYDYLLKI